MDPYGFSGRIGPKAVANHRGNDHHRAWGDLFDIVVQRDFSGSFKDGVDLGTIPVIVSGRILNERNMQVETQIIGLGNDSGAGPAWAGDRLNLILMPTKRGVFHGGSRSLLRLTYIALWIMALGIALIGTGCARIDSTPAAESPDTTLLQDPFAQWPKDSGDGQPLTGASSQISGKVTWKGPVGERKPWLAAQSSLPEKPKQPIVPRNNPFWPKIGKNGEVEGVVVALVGGPVPKNAPWKHGPLRVVLKDNDLLLMQGTKPVGVGLVLPGDPLTVARTSGDYDSIKFRGADFFTAPLVQTQLETKIPVRRTGVIKIKSSAGHFWIQGQIIASPTPFSALTDEEGNFSFDGIPQGKWSILLYHPGWLEQSLERDGETLEPYLLHLGPDLFTQLPQGLNAPRHFQMDPSGFSSK